MASIIVRKSNLDDVDEIVDIAIAQWKAIYEEYHDLLGDEIYSSVFSYALLKKAEIVRKGALDSNHCVVAECDGVICGFCCFEITENGVGVISNNAVSSDFRGKGIAGKLYDRVLDDMRSAGCHTAKVQTGLDNAHAPARRAYEKAGFEVGLPSLVYYKKL